jgi:competence CoiA-like predicted nuclease
VILLGVKPAYRSRSIFQLFVDELFRRGKAYGALGAEASWVLEDNRLLTKPMELMGAKTYKVWRVFERGL